MTYDVIVVGAGHAGCEAAHAAARLGRHVAICTLSPDTVAHTQIMTSVSGNESCAVCHGPGDAWDVKKVHGL